MQKEQVLGQQVHLTPHSASTQTGTVKNMAKGFWKYENNGPNLPEPMDMHIILPTEETIGKLENTLEGR